MKKILKITKIKIICNVLFSLSMVLSAMFLPLSIMRGAFAQLSFTQKLLSFFVSYIVSFIFYYPMVASFVYLLNSIKNSVYILKEIILAVIFISIFNPLTVSMVFVKLFSTQVVLDISQGQVSRNEVQNSNKLTCGLRISDFAVGSKVEEAGIVKGENIFRLNGVQIGSIQDIFDQLNNKKIGDNVSLETDQGLKIVELVPNANDPSRPALGVKLIYNQCK